MEIPRQFETERLILRCLQPGMGAIVNAAILESLDELRPWMEWVHPVPSVHESEELCRRAHENYLAGHDFALHLLLKDSLDFVGSSGLHRRNAEVPAYEIGYWLRAGYAGQGFASEAVAAIAEIGRIHLRARRIEIRMSDRNERSWRVAERCGFPLEGILKNERRELFGGLRDTRVYAKTWPDEEFILTAEAQRRGE